MKPFVKLNPEISLRNDKGATFLVKVNGAFLSTYSAPSIMILPPFIGKIFSEIGRYPYEEAVNKLAVSTGLTDTALKSFTQQLLNSEIKRKLNIDQNLSLIFPEKILIDSDEPETRFFDQHPEWKWNDDFNPNRPTMPFNVNLMSTLKCNTDCIYCYANRKLEGDLLSSDELIALIENLYSNGVINLTLTGGDLFAMKDWQKVVKAALSKGYHPFISTKTPLSKKDIEFLRELGYTDIQFSLDSNDPEILTTHLKVDGKKYLDRVEKMLSDCDEIGLKVQIRTVITSFNSDIEHIKKFYIFLSAHSSISEWDITPAFFSHYKGVNTVQYKPDNEDLKQIYHFTKEDNLRFPISLNKVSEKGYCLKLHDNVESFAAHNVVCNANYSCISILANGDCVLCEMLYESPEYKLGNIREQTVKELWNSEKALFLYNPPQSKISDDSPCHSCRVYSTCKQGMNKRICYVNIQKTGGNLSSPDPACPMAPLYDLIL